MAQVKEVSSKGLKREFVITVPQPDVEKHLVSRLEEIGKSARLPGFRPGKVPMEVLRKRFGASARAEVVDEAVSESAQKALSERKLRPAMQPQIELVSFAEGKDLEFKLAVEILPEITAPDFGKIALEKFVTEVPAKEIDDAITRAAKSMREPEVVTEDRAAKMGDVVVIDFDGSVGGEPRPGMKGEGHRLELGSKSFIDNFEEQIVGMKAGGKKKIKVKFPDAYHAAELAGKEAEFAVELRELRAPKPVEMNDELAKDLGFDSIADLRKRVAEDLGQNYEQLSRTILKRHLMDKLAETQKFEIPAGMMETEFGNIWKQVEAARARGELDAAEAKKSDEELKKDYRAIAERRIRLGLLLAEVGEQNKIAVAPNDLRNAMIAEARRFPGREKAVIDYYTKTEGAIERLRAPLLEEKVVDFILSKAKVTDKKIAAEELAKMPEEME